MRPVFGAALLENIGIYLVERVREFDNGQPCFFG
jgi:hypothetical protein